MRTCQTLYIHGPLWRYHVSASLTAARCAPQIVNKCGSISGLGSLLLLTTHPRESKWESPPFREEEVANQLKNGVVLGNGCSSCLNCSGKALWRSHLSRPPREGTLIYSI